MSTFAAFFLGVAATLVVAALVAWHLKPHLRALLVEICGNEARAGFWLAFTNVALLVVPALAAMDQLPRSADIPETARQIILQLKWALLGLIFIVGAVGVVLWSHIRSRNVVIPEFAQLPEGGGEHAQ